MAPRNVTCMYVYTILKTLNIQPSYELVGMKRAGLKGLWELTRWGSLDTRCSHTPHHCQSAGKDLLVLCDIHTTPLSVSGKEPLHTTQLPVSGKEPIFCWHQGHPEGWGKWSINTHISQGYWKSNPYSFDGPVNQGCWKNHPLLPTHLMAL